MTTRSGRPTLADVADRAGVSLGTASKAMGGTGQLSTATRAKVLEAASSLGFRPRRAPAAVLTTALTTAAATASSAARSTAPSGSRGAVSSSPRQACVVGVLTTDSIGRFTIPILSGVEDVLGADRASLLLCQSRGDAIREQHYLQMLHEHPVDGILVTGRSSAPRPSLGDRANVPVVYALSPSDDPADTSVVHDDRGGSALAVEHLLQTGRRRIAHVGGPAHHRATAQRLTGVMEALEVAELPLVLDEPLLGDWSEQWGREAAVRLHRSGEELDGVVCGNDQIARGVIDGLREVGRRVPQDVAVVGMDDWDAMVLGSRPQLSTVDLQLTELGRRAAGLLLAAVGGQPARGGEYVVPSRLVKRRSSELL